jgi:PAS domain-containing protein
MEFRMRHEDGHFVWVHGTAQTAWSDVGAPVLMVGSITDISSKKYAEEALIRSEELNNLAVRGMSVGLWDWNILTGDITTSYKMHEILGWNFGSDFVSNFDDFVARVHPEDIERLTMVTNSHLVHHVPYDVEYRLRMDDGSYIWLHACGFNRQH